MYNMGQSKTIFLPDDETQGKMIQDSWQKCKEEAAKAGLDLSNPTLEGFAQDMFVAGYCYGHNDCLQILGGQLEAMNLINDVFSSKE